jgi:hypothetical protein
MVITSTASTFISDAMSNCCQNAPVKRMSYTKGGGRSPCFVGPIGDLFGTIP